MNLDLILSHWIFIWYLLYYFKIVNLNPKLAIICGIIVNIFLVFLMLFYRTNIKIIIFFILIAFITKVIPLFTISKKIDFKKDIYVGSILFCIYLIWVVINFKKMHEFIGKIKKIILYKKSGSLKYVDNILDIT